MNDSELRDFIEISNEDDILKLAQNADFLSSKSRYAALIEAGGFPVNKNIAHYGSLLNIAIRNWDIESANYLLDIGADPNIQDSYYERNALSASCFVIGRNMSAYNTSDLIQSGWYDLIYRILDSKCNPHTPDINGDLAIDFLSNNREPGLISRIKEYMNRWGFSITESQNLDEFETLTPDQLNMKFEKYCRNDNSNEDPRNEYIIDLFRAGLDPNSDDHHIFIGNQYLKCSILDVILKDCITNPSNFHKIALTMLECGLDVNLVELNIDPIVYCVSHSKQHPILLDTISHLVKGGFGVNGFEWENMPPISRAISSSNYEAVKLLIKLGADVSLPYHKTLKKIPIKDVIKSIEAELNL